MDNEKLPSGLFEETLKLTQITLRPTSLILKFFTLNLLGAIATLMICPQYGFGLFSWNAGISNVVMSYGPIICGIFCSSIFFMGGHGLTYAFLNRCERKWVYRHGFVMTIPYVSFLFMLGMGLKTIAPGHIHHDVVSYYGSWLLTAFIVSAIFLQIIKLRVNRTAILVSKH